MPTTRLLLLLACFSYAEGRVFEGCVSWDSVNERVLSRDADATSVCACGATLAESLYSLASFAYAQHGRVVYTGTGSSTGKDSVIAHTVDFAGSDSLLKPSQYAAAPDLQVCAA
jgi:ABC-type phosphate transport system substrate-binding protein